MDSTGYTKVECGNCGISLPETSIEPDNMYVCPECGSNKKHIELALHDHFKTSEIKESISGKLNDANYNSRRKTRYEFFEGDEWYVTEGKWIKKTRIIDKRNNTYFEKVTDPDTGKDIHFCEESLTSHFGHGQAKFKKNE